GVVDPAVMAADDKRDVAAGIDRQGCSRRFRYRRDAVVDKQHAADLAQFLLAVRQPGKPVGRLEGGCGIDIERVYRRQRRAEVGGVVGSSEVRVAYLPHHPAAIEYRRAARVNSPLFIEKISL